MSQVAELEKIDERMTHLEEEVQSLRELVATEDRQQSTLIERNPEVCGGEPVLTGTRTPVRGIIQQIHQGTTPSELFDQMPHLNMEQVRAALEYYRRHKADIDNAVALNEDEEFWKAWLQSRQ